MLGTAILALALIWAPPAPPAGTGQGGSLIPEGIRAIATPDDCAIILVSDPTNGVGRGVGWLGVGGAIACDADNSIIVWSGAYTSPAPPPPPVWPRPAIQPPPPPPVVPSQLAPPPAVAPFPPNQQFLWPEGVDDARPFDLDNSIVIGPDS